jgi:tetratricopeptide (TPR) repeat protein
VQRGFSEIAPSMAVVMALIGFTIWCWWRYRPLAFPSIWFFGILSVTSSVMPVADLAVEHRMYLPLIGPITLLVLAGNWAFHMRLKNAPHRRIQTAWIAAGTVVIIVLSLIRLTDARNRDYHDRFVMWSKVAEQRPHNYRAQTILAGYLIDRNELDAAIALAQHVVTERDPGYFPAHYKLALAYYTKGRDADAWRHLERALSIYPSHAEAHNLMGLIRYRQGRSQEATDFYRRAIALDPYRAQYHHNFGLALMKQEDWSAAATAFRDETELQPDAIESFHGLGYVLARQGNYQDALLAWRRTLEINPQFWPTVYEVAWVLATCPENGIRDGAEALRLAHRLPFDPKKPNSARLEVLAAAYAETGQFSEAIKTAEQMQQLPVVSGTSLIPVTGREERLSLYKAGRPYRLQSIHGDFESK